MIRRPRNSTLFPTRRSSDLCPADPWQGTCRLATPTPPSKRSEEHTSELQSRSDLVCRLLLEKKNTRSDDRSHPSASPPPPLRIPPPPPFSTSLAMRSHSSYT